MAGRLAPFIELGVGFNPELTARENVVLNGVLMGLTRREARRRLDAVLDFAELRGLRRPQAEELLVGDDGPARVRGDGRRPTPTSCSIDEVLAVGDAAFAQKCMDVFREKRDARARRSSSSPTTWRPSRRSATARCSSTTASCSYIGDPEDDGAALLPAELRRAGRRRARGRGDAGRQRAAASTRGCADAAGERVENVEQGDADRASTCVLEARARRSTRPVFGFHFVNADGVDGVRLQPRRSSATRSPAGPRACAFAGAIENPLRARAATSLDCWIRAQPRRRATWRCTSLRLLDFVVYGTEPRRRASSRVRRRRRGRSRRSA